MKQLEIHFALNGYMVMYILFKGGLVFSIWLYKITPFIKVYLIMAKKLISAYNVSI